jgi:K+/H+ antiporter YhaU regulatory subunit KhtT
MEFLGDNRELISQELKKLHVEIDELRLHKRTHLIGKTILELQNMSEGHLLVIALQRADGNILRSGFLEERLAAGDAVIIIGRVLSLPPALREEVDRQDIG